MLGNSNDKGLHLILILRSCKTFGFSGSLAGGGGTVFVHATSLTKNLPMHIVIVNKKLPTKKSTFKNEYAASHLANDFSNTYVYKLFNKY